MWQFLGMILLAGIIVFAFQVALLLIFLVGLIFRPRETLSLLAVLVAFWVLRTYPIPTLGVLAVVAVVALARNARNVRSQAEADKPPELTDDTGG